MVSWWCSGAHEGYLGVPQLIGKFLGLDDDRSGFLELPDPMMRVSHGDLMKILLLVEDEEV